MISSMTLIAKVTLNGFWTRKTKKDAKISTMEKIREN
jgi:hypothetical protein